uniref:SGNH hydrolase-type esterase domain-containing protein n=1 Tax=Colobus angolensis palliatus TaxID=336983 RepID=A0A2K5J1T8_COLAP
MSQADSNTAAIPHVVEDIQGDDRWISQHNRFVLDGKDKKPNVLFVGDPMVQLMQQHEIWRELFPPFHALNFGTEEDTRHSRELENIKPKVIVVWVGTNNHENTAVEQPQGKILVLEKPNPLRQKVSLLKLAHVGFMYPDSAISCHEIFDFLHLTGEGYAKICRALYELIVQQMEETPKEKQTTIA